MKTTDYIEYLEGILGALKKKARALETSAQFILSSKWAANPKSIESAKNSMDTAGFLIKNANELESLLNLMRQEKN